MERSFEIFTRGVCFWFFTSRVSFVAIITIPLAFRFISGRKAMFVSNHNSWMDIPFIGHTIGWHNYKFVAKKELEKVPILGKAIMVSKNVCVDRSDRKSQLMTLKQGMKWLDVSGRYYVFIHLALFVSLKDATLVICAFS